MSRAKLLDGNFTSGTQPYGPSSVCTQIRSGLLGTTGSQML